MDGFWERDDRMVSMGVKGWVRGFLHEVRNAEHTNGDIVCEILDASGESAAAIHPGWFRKQVIRYV